MCIIVYKPAEAPFPDRTVLDTCFLNNSDGAGYMYAVNGRVYIKKGFMSFDALMKSLKHTRKQCGDKIPYVLHFRIATQGGAKPELTHPYPLSEEMADLKRLNSTSDIGIAHNGIISLTASNKKDIDYNDTMTFITDYLSLIIRDKGYWKDPATVELINRLADSKLAILDGSGHCELIGDFKEDDGIYYSNYTYLYSNSYLYGHMKYGSVYGGYSLYDEYTECPMLYGYEDYAYCFDCPEKKYCYDSDDEIMKLII